MATTATLAARPKPALKRLMWIGILVLCAIAAAVVVRRITALVSPPRNVPAQLAGLDQVFADKEALTLTHIIPGLAFVILVPFQLSRSWRNRHLRAHRWMGRIVMILGVIIGLSALAMSSHPIGGAIESSATIFFDLFFLFALTEGYLHIRRREIALHREWIIRAMAIALGIATVRPVMGFFFATSRFTGLTPHQFFGIAFWIGFSLTYLAGELWIRYTRVTITAKV
ncbi:MAG TPA: DUF2306 domain-containing protein [Terriglobales bacterium]|nr:DUF2306 domain-containing protein [Terriglobales bacterium]